MQFWYPRRRILRLLLLVEDETLSKTSLTDVCGIICSSCDVVYLRHTCLFLFLFFFLGLLLANEALWETTLLLAALTNIRMSKLAALDFMHDMNNRSCHFSRLFKASWGLFLLLFAFLLFLFFLLLFFLLLPTRRLLLQTLTSSLIQWCPGGCRFYWSVCCHKLHFVLLFLLFIAVIVLLLFLLFLAGHRQKSFFAT